MEDVERAVRAVYRALEEGAAGDDLLALMTDDVETREHPNLLVPHGALHDRDAMHAGSLAGASLLRSQRYVVDDVLVAGDVAAVRCRWSAVVAQDAGPFTAGQELTAELAQFVTVRDGRVSRIETYDCYDPF